MKYYNVYSQITQIVRPAVWRFHKNSLCVCVYVICSVILTDYASVDSPFSRCAALTKWRLVSLKQLGQDLVVPKHWTGLLDWKIAGLVWVFICHAQNNMGCYLPLLKTCVRMKGICDLSFCMMSGVLCQCKLNADILFVLC